MTELRLAKLPSRTPAKITITVSAELNQTLLQYAEVYRSIYGDEEPVAELIPFMLHAFLDSDREFGKAQKNRVVANGGASSMRTASQELTSALTPTAKEF